MADAFGMNDRMRICATTGIGWGTCQQHERFNRVEKRHRDKEAVGFFGTLDHMPGRQREVVPAGTQTQFHDVLSLSVEQ